MRMKNLIIFALFSLSAALPLAAQAVNQRANLNGTWKLNIEKSSLAKEHPAEGYGLTRVIKQNDATIAFTDTAIHVAMMNIPLPDYTRAQQMFFDGKEHPATEPGPFPGMPPTPITTLAAWQGNTLLIEKRGPGIFHTRDRFFLSDDGRQLIQVVASRVLFGESEQRLVFDRTQ